MSASTSNDCWGAFGSDSDSESSSDYRPKEQTRLFDAAADATSLAITQHFASLAKSGVLLRERVVGGSCRDGVEHLREIMTGRIGGRGMKILWEGPGENEGRDFLCDAAILLCDDATATGGGADPRSSRIRRALLPGGFLWLVTSFQRKCDVNTADEHTARPEVAADAARAMPGERMAVALNGYSEAIWDVDSASLIHSSADLQVISVQKRECTINAKTCPWMEKQQKIRGLVSAMGDKDAFRISENDTFLQYERKVASAVTVSPSVAERTRGKMDESNCATVLTEANISRATSILQEHGLVVIKGLINPAQTIPWGRAVLSDFKATVERLRCHPTRPVDLMNPRTNDAHPTPPGERVFEPLSYKEMAMREDLRVDLRSGPNMETLRCMENEAFQSVATTSRENKCNSIRSDSLSLRPAIVDSDCTGTVKCWRFNPSILAIIRATFNPRDETETLYKGNFGRWNFGRTGPDGSPQSFRLGQVGSVVSCPGAGDQAIHADTPHLFECLPCHPCHYLNVFTPGYNVINDPDNDCFRNEFDRDAIWTGNSTLGGTAFVHGSHKLSVTSQLLSENDADMMGTDKSGDNRNATLRRQLLQLRTVRPALDAGDVVLFDCRTIHFGMANTSRSHTTGKDMSAGRRPMLYLNVSQLWFHDPKNWDDQESIFD